MLVELTVGFACLLLVPVALARVSTRVDRAVSSLALLAFGGLVGSTDRTAERRTRLRSAHVATSYPVYSATTVLYAGLVGLACSLLAMVATYGVVGVLLGVDPEGLRGALPDGLATLASLAALSEAAPGTYLRLTVAFVLALGPWFAIATYLGRWWRPAYVADLRSRRIDAAMPRTIAFMYAMARSGMSVPASMAVLARNRAAYGAAAEEMAVAVRAMEGFGVDMITAVSMMGRRSASQRYREFAENLAGVLQSGRDVPGFLREQYERHQEEAEATQERLLTVLATTAEIWVALLVGGPLFLITVLIVIGVTIHDTLPLLRLLVYVVLPLANLGFIVYLGVLFDRIEGRTSPPDAPPTGADAPAGATDAIHRADGGRLPGVSPARSVGYAPLHRLANPVALVVNRPAVLLVVTVPLALIASVARLPGAVADGTVDAAALDTIALQAVLFVVVTFAIAYEFHRRRIASIERHVPDLLERLASINEAGMTLVTSMGRVRHGGLGRLDAELEYIWRDLQWGATLEEALGRFERRVRTAMVSRVVTLVVMSMRASGEVASVLRIAAAQAAADRRLQRARRREMATYVFIAYLSFLVFLLVLGAMTHVLLPSLPDATVDPATVPGAVSTPLFGRIGAVDRAAYELVFYHAILVQGFFSGVVAGHMSAADVRNGAKHAAAMLLIGWAVFWLLL